MQMQMKIKWLLLTVLVFLPWAAFAQTTTSSTAVDPGAVQEGLGVMARAFKSGNWALAAGTLLTVVVALLRIVGALKVIPDKYDQYVAIGAALATSIGVGLTTGQPWDGILMTAANVGLVAVGGWEAVGRVARDKLAKR